ncbi:L-2-hydroxyglutarate oxidase [Aestuariibacter salexigens]|uniref:L-2-hydroxyglutarate oxidase n=1 Tax=Aestuariibacter salexigens TaxID=226010 RepID=UPI0004241F6B|nr:L-2-hydroxyglutarate oxidase [Aestuariibacter salexigens]
MQHADIVIIGAGIVGAATAQALQGAVPRANIMLLEKELEPAQHQTGRNSGVIHAGVYYPPGSLKARYCREGLTRTIAFCNEHGIPFDQCGKLLVATNDDEMTRMQDLYIRCQENELDPEMLSKQQLQNMEPNICGKGAFFVRQTGITDYRAITTCLTEQFRTSGGEVCYSRQVIAADEHDNGATLTVKTGQHGTDQVQAKVVVNCAGLQSDLVARRFGVELDYQIIPFKGEYFRLSKKFDGVVQRLIYPIPDPSMPFLGVHLTKMVHGGVTVGPSAVLSLAREGYHKFAFSLSDTVRMACFAGFWKTLWKHKRAGLIEARNALSKISYLSEVQKYCTAVSIDDLLPYPSGIRAQAVSIDGQLIHDFKFIETDRAVHLGNAPSPAATSAFPIADAIVDRVLGKL